MTTQSIKTLMITVTMFVFLLGSCTRDINENESAQKQELSEVDEKNFTESDEDIYNIDYKDFYDELSSDGEWISVSAGEPGIEIGNGTASEEMEIQKDLISKIFGVSSAYADVDAGMFFVWKPSPELAVTAVVADEPRQYTPYYNGQWIYTDAGWYFRAPTRAEEITHHYGRWTLTPAHGWVWVPGRVWAPAWVEWRANDNYIAWAPVPPSVYIVDNVLPIPIITEDRFIIVEKRYFVEPLVYNYVYTVDREIIRLNDMSRLNGVIVSDGRVVVQGPAYTEIVSVSGKNVDRVEILKVRNKNDVQFGKDKMKVYVPEFKRVNKRSNEKTTVNKPGKFVDKDSKRNPEATGNRKDLNSEKRNEGNDAGNKVKKNNENFKSDDNRKSGPRQENMKKRGKTNSDVQNKKSNREKSGDRDNDRVKKQSNDGVKKQNNDGVKKQNNDGVKKQNNNNRNSKKNK